MQRKHYIVAIAAILSLAIALIAYLWATGGVSGTVSSSSSAGPRVAPGALTATQIERLGIRTAPAEAAVDVPLGTVPAVISLPPEAQVAVTAPFDGAVIRLFVVQGQAVSKGQALALLKSREPVQYGAELARAHARLALAEVSAARTRQLVDEGIIAASRADEMNAQIRVARTDVSENARILSQAGASANGNLTLRAPIAGRVAMVNVQTGGPVGGTTAPFVIENNAALTLDLQLPERLANSVAPGMTVVLQSPGGGTEIQGTILSVGASMDPLTRSIPAKARIGAAPSLVPGKSVMAIIKGASIQSGASVPASALTQIDGKEHVFVRVGNRFERRGVVSAGRADGRVLISEGLKPGDLVAISGISELKAMLEGN
ncbi:MAG: efflux RND transporter periplasmic adaptor subunit [Sphingorhabdus sp.]